MLSYAITALVALATPAQLPGQPGARYMRLFDAKTVETVEAEVTEVRHVEHRMMRMQAVELSVKTADSTYAAHLGPAWFIDNQELQLKVGDKIKLTGSKVSVEGKPTIISSVIERGDDLLKLRETDGTPVWSAWRRRGVKGS